MKATLRLFWNRVIGIMFRTKFVPLFSIILLLTALICFCSVQAMAQSEPPDEEITDPPHFIIELVRNTELKPRQVERMRNSGAGWGNIMIATRLAERIAADSEGLMTFDEALADVFRARTAGKGFGQIANENDLKLGRVLSGEDDTPLERDLEGEDDTPDSTNPPPFIVELVRNTELNRNQVQRMRNSGAGWGNIMISARLAERIAADSEGLMTFDEALGDVFRSRAEGKGFGQIANENDLKLGRVLSGKDDTPLRRDLQGEDDTPLEQDLQGEDDTPDSTNPPPFIVELVRKTELNRNQVERMRNSGAGWGNIMISARLAERIAADSEGLMTFDEALGDVFRARTEGKGFGQIANENDLKLGRVLSGKDDTPLRRDLQGEDDTPLERDLEGEDDTPDSTNPPPFIVDLVRNTELNRNQVKRMRNSGVGWGNIMITTRLAERIAADSEGLLTFDEALADVFRARTEGMGFGEIAHENDLKLGRVIGKGNKNSTTPSSNDGTEEDGAGSAPSNERGKVKAKKQNALGRFARFLGLGKKKRYEKPPKAEKFERPDRPRRPDKPERPEKPEKPEKPERPEKPEKPEKPPRPGR